jgi:hypothetical protein
MDPDPKMAESPSSYGMLHGCPTPPPAASSAYGPPRFLPHANHTPPLYKRKPLHVYPAGITPIGQNQFSFNRATSIERSSRPSSVSGHAYVGTTSEESDDDESSEEDDRPKPAVKKAGFELEKLGRNETGSENLEIVRPDHPDMKRPKRVVEEPGFALEEVDSDTSDGEVLEIVRPYHIEDARGGCEGATQENMNITASLGALGVSEADGFGPLQVSEESADEQAGARERIRRRRKKRLSIGWIDRKRDYNCSVAGDSSYSEDDPQDDNDIGARRLRRSLSQHGPWDRQSLLIFEDRGFPNTNNLWNEQLEDGVIKHVKGPPSIPGDDAFTLDDLPFWAGFYEQFEVMPDDDQARRQDVGVGADFSTDPHASERPSNTGAPSREQDIVDIEDDRRSVISAESSTTLVSTLSGLTEVELESATVELQNIFQGDAGLVELYRRAIKDTTIGPERLQRNIGQLLKPFARDLRQEASEELQKRTSNFVSMKASFIAQCIIEEYNDRKVEPKLQKCKTERARGGKTGAQELDSRVQKRSQNRPVEDREITRDEDRMVVDQYGGDGGHPELDVEQADDDDLDCLAPVDEDYFEDLLALRAFLIESAAFKTFRQELAKFVLPKELRPSHAEDGKRDSAADITLARRWRVLAVIESILKRVLVVTGLLEPPLRPTMVRLRWQCVSHETAHRLCCIGSKGSVLDADLHQYCSESFFEDVTEYESGGVSELVEEMRPFCTKITATAHSEGGSNPAYSSAPLDILRTTWAKVLNPLKKHPVSPVISSQENAPQVAGEDVEAESAVPPTQTLLLLAGLHRSRDETYLAQEDIEEVRTDRQLFCFMRAQLDNRHDRFRRFFCMTRVKDIHFSKASDGQSYEGF